MQQSDHRLAHKKLLAHVGPDIKHKFELVMVRNLAFVIGILMLSVIVPQN